MYQFKIADKKSMSRLSGYFIYIFLSNRVPKDLDASEYIPRIHIVDPSNILVLYLLYCKP